MILRKNSFLNYKLFNSSFTGLSIGILFQIYQPLTPTTYSIGGIVLATCMLIVAKFYEKLLNIKSFYYISIMVEFIILLTIMTFLIMQYSLTSALLIYIGYQLTFIFGSYLIRVETLALKKDEILTKVDIAKQYGYLIGMGISYIFYKILENVWQITDNQEQVYLLHFVLLAIEIIVITLLLKAFQKIG